jgi:hypothetical protein
VPATPTTRSTRSGRFFSLRQHMHAIRTAHTAESRQHQTVTNHPHTAAARNPNHPLTSRSSATVTTTLCIRRRNVHPQLRHETLQQILAATTSPYSATTLLHKLSGPGGSAPRVVQALQPNGLHSRPELSSSGPQTEATLDEPEHLVPGSHVPAMADAACTPAQRPRRLARRIKKQASTRSLPCKSPPVDETSAKKTAGDIAAVLYWRLPTRAPAGPSPAFGCPAIPEKLHEQPARGDYLTKRSPPCPTASGARTALGPNKFENSAMADF